MNRILVCGVGAVSPAGWGCAALCDALAKQVPLPSTLLAGPMGQKPLAMRIVPPPSIRPSFLAHPRLRRASPMAQHVVGAALEALGDDAGRVQKSELKLGIIVSTMTGCVDYSRRFYQEVLKDPPTASPMLFPETVFNAPASHLAAYLESPGLNHTLVGDEGTFLQGIAMGAQWLVQNQVDACVVVGAEEMDWIVADALRNFSRRSIYAVGAGAIYLRRADASSALAELDLITDAFLFTQKQGRAGAVRKLRAALPAEEDSTSFPRVRHVFGDAFNAGAAWCCAAACESLRAAKTFVSNVAIVGTNQQAISARFIAPNERKET